MAVSSPSAAALLDLPLEVLIDVCEQLDIRDLIRVAQACKRLFRHGEGGLDPAELPTKSPVVMALREHAFPGGVGTISCGGRRECGCGVIQGGRGRDSDGAGAEPPHASSIFLSGKQKLIVVDGRSASAMQLRSAVAPRPRQLPHAKPHAPRLAPRQERPNRRHGRGAGRRGSKDSPAARLDGCGASAGPCGLLHCDEHRSEPMAGPHKAPRAGPCSSPGGRPRVPRTRSSPSPWQVARAPTPPPHDGGAARPPPTHCATLPPALCTASRSTRRARSPSPASCVGWAGAGIRPLCLPPPSLFPMSQGDDQTLKRTAADALGPFAASDGARTMELPEASNRPPRERCPSGRASSEKLAQRPWAHVTFIVHEYDGEEARRPHAQPPPTRWRRRPTATDPLRDLPFRLDTAP
jgi:hypothetical protein